MLLEDHQLAERSRGVKRRLEPWLFIAPVLVLTLVVGVYPLVYSLVITFFEVDYGVTAGMEWVGIANYAAILRDPGFLQSLRLSAIFVAASVICSLVLGLGLAMLVNREFRGVGVLRSLLIVPMVVTPVSIGLTWRMIFNDQAGILNYLLGTLGLPTPLWHMGADTALLAAIIVDIWQWTPFMFLILLAGLRSLPRTPFDAARVDGAGALQRFRHVTLPLMRRVILIALVLRAVDAMRIFDMVFILTRGGPAQATDLFSIFVYRIGFKFGHTSYAAAISWVLVMLSSILLMMFVRVSGLFKDERGVR